MAQDEGDKLRKTTATLITEDQGEFLGLPGGSIFMVLGAFAVVQVLTKMFPLALGIALAIFLTMRIWLRGKPSHYLGYWVWEKRAPKKYRHRAGEGAARPW
jgi:hypothetical protein